MINLIQLIFQIIEYFLKFHNNFFHYFIIINFNNLKIKFLFAAKIIDFVHFNILIYYFLTSIINIKLKLYF